MFTLEEKSKKRERRHPQYARKATPENEARYAAMAERIAELVEMAEQAASAECAIFGSYDATPNVVEAFGVHDAIESQFAGVFGERHE